MNKLNRMYIDAFFLANITSLSGSGGECRMEIVNSPKSFIGEVMVATSAGNIRKPVFAGSIGKMFSVLRVCLFLVMLIISFPSISMGDASGEVNIYPTIDAENKLTHIEAELILYEDNTCWYDFAPAMCKWAVIFYYLDGAYKGRVFEFFYTFSGANNLWGVPITFYENDGFSNLQQGEHVVTYKLMDVLPNGTVGGVIAEDSVTVCVDEIGTQYLGGCTPVEPPDAPDNNDYGDEVEEKKEEPEKKKKDKPERVEPPEKPEVSNKDGDPVSVYNGNNYVVKTDIEFPSPAAFPLKFKRAYNSRSSANGSMGYGWTHTYNVYLEQGYNVGSQSYLKITDATGRGIYFQDDGNGEFSGAFNELSHVTQTADGYIWHRLDNSRSVLDDTGRLVQTEDSGGNLRVMEYNGTSGLLETITDEASGRALTLNYNSDGRIESIIGPVTQAVSDGVWVTYQYDADGNLTHATYADGSGYVYEYDDPQDSHNMTAKRNAAGHLLSSWEYDDQDRVVDNFAPNGAGAGFNYVSDTRVDVTDAYGETKTYTIGMVNGKKRVTEISGLKGTDVIRVVYDEDMNVNEAEYANGHIDLYDDFDERGNAGTAVAAYGTSYEKTFTYTFHPDLNVRLTRSSPSILGAGNKVTIWDYDDDGDDTPNEDPGNLLYRRIETGYTRDDSGAVVSYEHVTTYEYNTKGQMTAIDGPLPGDADKVFYTYDSATGNLLTVTFPNGSVVTYASYDAAGYPGSMIDENNRELQYTYDGRGRTLTVTDTTDNTTETYVYDTAGDLTSRTAANGVAIGYDYETIYGYLTEIADPTGGTVNFGYDTEGNPTAQTILDSLGATRFSKTFDYHGPDFPGKLYREINPDASEAVYAYDAAGNLTSATDANGKTTTFAYDEFNRLYEITQPGSRITTFTYDTSGNLSSVTDAENHQTTFIHDDLGRVVQETSPDRGTTRYVYDEAGNLIFKTDANNVTTTYTYDGLNRLTGVQYPDETLNVTYSYDEGENGMGRRTGMADTSGETAYIYDTKGRLAEEIRTQDGNAYSTGYAYDASGVQTSLTLPSGREVVYNLDAAGRVSNVTLVSGGSSSVLSQNISYLPFGPMLQMTLGNGLVIQRTFDLLYRVSDITTGSMQNVTYARDFEGNITGITDNLDASRTKSFTYDDLYRLTDATGILGITNYTYDDIGNRLTKTHDGATDTYAYEPGTSRLGQISGATVKGYDMDPAGNVIAIYDRQIGGNPASLAGQDRSFIYDAAHNLTAEVDDSGNIVYEYVYLNGERLAAVDVAGAVFFYISNHLGTPQKVVDSSGTVVWDADYMPFGEVVVNAEGVANQYRFPGQSFDLDTSLHYNYHRYFDPMIGRYLKADPVGMTGGVNLFTYVRNNPMNLIDPWGLADMLNSYWKFNGKPNLPKLSSEPFHEPETIADLHNKIQWHLRELSPDPNDPTWEGVMTGEAINSQIMWTLPYLFGEFFSIYDFDYYPPFTPPKKKPDSLWRSRRYSQREINDLNEKKKASPE